MEFDLENLNVDELLNDENHNNDDTLNNDNTNNDDTNNVNLDENWNGEDWKLKHGDNYYVPKSKEELINIANRGKLYDRKKDEMSKKEKEISDTYDYLVDWLQNYSSQLNPNENQDDQNLDLNDPNYDETLKLRQEFQEFKQQAEMKDAQKELIRRETSLMEKFPNKDWKVIGDDGKTLIDKVLERASETGNTNLEDVFKAISYEDDITKAKIEANKKDDQNDKGRKVLKKNDGNLSYDFSKVYKRGMSAQDFANRLIDDPNFKL